VYGDELARRGLGEITTEIRPASETPYYYAEDVHQQYLHKNPFGYRCHANTGVPFPETA
jgi:peptide-methionine (S)-S-oxide reductase